MISVCMATYNGARFLREQIQSILIQLGDQDEIIVSDDGSSDDTIKILESFNDKRIKIFRNTEIHGVNGNFENSLNKAKGDYIFLSDQDDVWFPDKVSKCLDSLKGNDCIVHDAVIVDKDLTPSGKTVFEIVSARKGILHNWIHNGYLGCAMAFRKKLLDDILPIPKSMPMYHDTWIGTIAGIKYNIAFIDYKGILFRRHDSNTSVTIHKRRSIKRIIHNRIAIIWHIGKRLILKR